MGKLQEDTINWAIKRFETHSDTDIFPKPFEYNAIISCKDEVINYLEKQEIHQWQSRTSRRCLVPKQRYGFRLATQLDPLDMLFFFCLFLEVGEEIESSRIKIDKYVSFSYRFDLENEEYSVFKPEINYQKFQEYCEGLAKKFPFVVLTDIADFYPRIYLHRIENSLITACKSHTESAYGIIKILKQLNQSVSYGIPVGNDPSRLLAEIVIDDVDRNMLSEGITFCRFVDDYRIFCNSREEGYKHLSKLANYLYESGGLTIQPHKTKIVPTEEFVDNILKGEEKKVIHGLDESFNDIIEALGFEDPYKPIDYFELPIEIRSKVDGLNLGNILSNQLENDEIDIPLTKFLLNHLGQLRQEDTIELILENLDKLYPVITEVVRYFSNVGVTISQEERESIGRRLIEKLDGTVVSILEFNRMQILSLFAGSNSWGNSENFPRLFESERSIWVKRALILALGKSEQDHWFRTKKSSVNNFTDWERRAVIYAASCLPDDEKKAWFNSISSNRHDPLDNWIIDWAKKNPINTVL
jgi:hypothetical protein